MQTGGHILSDFNSAMEDFRQKMITIGSLTQQNLENAIRGLLDRNIELCNQVIADDEEVDQLEIIIDEEGVLLMSKYRLFAGDLRMVISSMKITNNLERISDHAVSIAKRSRKILRNSELPENRLVEPIYQLANNMLTKALTAYNDGSKEIALEVIRADDELDALHKSTHRKLTKCLEGECSNYKDYLNLVFICRWLERVGDLSVNIAEDVVFMETATDIRHGGELSDEEE
ncbi:phosphate transport system protein [Rubritalea squalenifaciens DSM 18772]|uniref:Phosphate-specific transport system accessory protein PhoU n=1 Tax=Rubritalea squalenifaciens DSM 18772 TaxID=1123071 RepID=A0A1M6ERP9_9BACT|nr:phosphate signaling complex protein PhoU [Rubritalea squalenifaciens]SHI88151.1 phosphate transport system protein [Rubritalea squalenifaciens DSM 18772]